MLACALIGTTLLIVRSSIAAPVRRLWPGLLGCSQCTGMWVGALAGASGIVSLEDGRVLDALVVGAATSFLATLADAVLLNLLGDPGEKK